MGGWGGRAGLARTPSAPPPPPGSPSNSLPSILLPPPPSPFHRGHAPPPPPLRAQVAEKEKFYNNHLLESETYIGGHVDAIRSGVFRADHLQKFALDSAMYQTLIDRVDNALKFAIEVEGGLKMEEVTNYEEVRTSIAPTPPRPSA